MKTRSFTVKLEFEYDANEGIHGMKVLEINGEKATDGPREAPYVESTKDTYIGTIGTTIILTTRISKEADPCGWVWNPILRRWFWRCWDSETGDITKVP